MRHQLSGTQSKSRPRQLLLVLTTLIGVHLGAEYHVRSGKTFLSTATVQIEPKSATIIEGCWGAPPNASPDFDRIEHDKLIASENAISKCIERYPELKAQTSFSRVAEDQVAAEISKNVTVKRDREDPFIFELRYRAKNPFDGSLILNRLLRSHQESLKTKTEDLAKRNAALLEADCELEPKKIEAFRSLHHHLHGYRFRSLCSVTHDESARLFWSIFVGAAIAFSVTAVAIVGFRFKSPNHRSPNDQDLQPHAKAPSSQSVA